MYSGTKFSDIPDLLYECMKEYNIIPDNSRASKTKIKLFCVTLDEHAYICVFDPSNLNTGLNWKASEKYVDNMKLNLRIKHLSSLLNI